MTTLCETLRDKTRDFLGSESPDGTADTPKSESGPGTRFIDTVRKALIARVRNPNVVSETNNNNAKKTPFGSVSDTPTPVVSSLFYSFTKINIYLGYILILEVVFNLIMKHESRFM